MQDVLFQGRNIREEVTATDSSVASVAGAEASVPTRRRAATRAHGAEDATHQPAPTRGCAGTDTPYVVVTVLCVACCESRLSGTQGPRVEPRQT